MCTVFPVETPRIDTENDRAEVSNVQRKWSHVAPWSLKAPLLPDLPKKNKNTRTQRARARGTTRALHPCVSIIRPPGRPVILVPRKCHNAVSHAYSYIRGGNLKKPWFPELASQSQREEGAEEPVPRERKMHTKFDCTNLLNTPKGPEHPSSLRNPRKQIFSREGTNSSATTPSCGRPSPSPGGLRIQTVNHCVLFCCLSVRVASTVEKYLHISTHTYYASWGPIFLEKPEIWQSKASGLNRHLNN